MKPKASPTSSRRQSIDGVSPGAIPPHVAEAGLHTNAVSRVPSRAMTPTGGVPLTTARGYALGDHVASSSFVERLPRVRVNTPEGPVEKVIPKDVLTDPPKDVNKDGLVKEECQIVAGLLEKWTNYGKGWRPRWFVLDCGVLSYYKIHGPDKVHVQEERVRRPDMLVLGEDALKLEQKDRRTSQVDHASSFTTRRPKAQGEVHLMVSTLRESSSDDRKFYIHTGTKTLHLRAESRDDRAIWLDKLQTAKFQFLEQDRGLLVPNSVAVSLGDTARAAVEALREKLAAAGASAELQDDCEDILRQEITSWQVRLQGEREKRRTLLEYVRQLEADKVELETTVVDSAGDQSRAIMDRLMMEGEGGSEGSEEDNHRETDAGDSDEDDNNDDRFFDTAEDFLVADKFRRLNSKGLDGKPGSPFTESEGGSPLLDSTGGAAGRSLSISRPPVVRRTELPPPMEKEKSVSLWHIIRDNVGKDLTRVCLPVFFNEPISALQKCAEDLEYSYLLDRAYEAGRLGNSLERILNVCAFAVSGYAATDGRSCKPFNPLLGETYEADRPDQGIRFFSEKVCHHPTIVACHCMGQGWTFWGESNVKSKFWGRSIQIDPVGTLVLEFADGEVFTWSKVTTSIHNLIIGKLYADHYGTMKVQGNHELSARIKFKEQSILDRNPHQVRGLVVNQAGEKLATIFGKWDDALYYVEGDISEKAGKLEALDNSQLLWRRANPAANPTRYCLSAYAITLNELTPGLEEQLPPTDSRLRPDQRNLELGLYDKANEEKQRLEHKQRVARKVQETGWKPRWFTLDPETGTYLFTGQYWNCKAAGNWEGCTDIFGPNLPTTGDQSV